MRLGLFGTVVEEGAEHSLAVAISVPLTLTGSILCHVCWVFCRMLWESGPWHSILSWILTVYSLSALLIHHKAFCCVTRSLLQAPTTCGSFYWIHSGNAGCPPASLLSALPSLFLTRVTLCTWSIIGRATFSWDLIIMIQSRGRVNSSRTPNLSI